MIAENLVHVRGQFTGLSDLSTSRAYLSRAFARGLGLLDQLRYIRAKDIGKACDQTRCWPGLHLATAESERG